MDRTERSRYLLILELSELLQHAGHRCRGDPVVVLAAAQKEPTVLEYADKTCWEHECWNEREYVLAAVQKQASVFGYVNGAWKDDREIAMTAVQKLPLMLQYASEACRRNQGIVLAAVQRDPSVIRFSKHLATMRSRCVSWVGHSRFPWELSIRIFATTSNSCSPWSR